MSARTLLLWAIVMCALLLAVLFASFGAEPFKRELHRASGWSQGAAAFFVESITLSQIQRDYQRTAPVRKLKILIVPGHQPGAGGTASHGVYERDVVVDIANDLALYLQSNGHYDVMVARSKEMWNPILQAYFNANAPAIEAFREAQIVQMETHLVDGSILPEADQVYHDSTPSLATTQLYGINKWTSEQHYDVTLHLHINDYGGRTPTTGRPTGFAIYVPNHQYSNANASGALGAAIAARMNAYHATSTLPLESAGVVEDQELIAIGSNNSADGAALLLEYGYIYEPQFQSASVLPMAERDYAYQTYLGLQDVLQDPVTPTYGSAALPYDLGAVMGELAEQGPGDYALQAALHYLGYYPTPHDSFSDCPVSGEVGPCTERALEAYQRARGLAPTGTVGPETRAALTRDLGVAAPSSLTFH